MGAGKKKDGHKFVLSLVKSNEKKWKYEFSFLNEEEMDNWRSVIENNWDLSIAKIFENTIEKAYILSNNAVPPIVIDFYRCWIFG